MSDKKVSQALGISVEIFKENQDLIAYFLCHITNTNTNYNTKYKAK